MLSHWLLSIFFTQDDIYCRDRVVSVPAFQLQGSQFEFRFRRTYVSFLNGPSSPLFCLFSSFQTNISILITNKCEKCPSSKRGPGFELTTFGTQVSSHNHQTRATAQNLRFIILYLLRIYKYVIFLYLSPLKGQ